MSNTDLAHEPVVLPDESGIEEANAATPTGHLGRVTAPDLKEFEVPVPRMRRLLDHVGITGQDVNARWRLNADMASFVADHRDSENTIDGRLGELLNYAFHVQAKDVDSGWTAFNAARREALLTASEPELAAHATGLLAASAAKLSGWRAATVAQLLTTDPESPAAIDPHTVAHAQQLVDEHNDNRYRQVAVHSRSLRFLACLVIGLLGVFGVVVGFDWLTSLEGTALDGLGSYAGIVALGCIGALLSVFTSRISGPDENPIADMAQRSTGYVRPLLGGLSAVVVVLVLESGVQTVVNFTGPGVYVGAVLAGFSERLIGRTLEGLAD